MTDRFQPIEESIDADDYRAFFNNDILRVWHLQGREITYRITRVTALTSEIVDRGQRKKTRQPKLELQTIKGRTVPLPLLLNKTNAKTIAQMYTKKPANWVGKLITLYPTTTEVGGETQDCIRIRNQPPAERRAAPASEPPPATPPSEPFDHERATKNEERHDDE
jgi:hypothetical protein